MSHTLDRCAVLQEQQQDAMKLRERVSQAALQRAIVLAEIKACKAALGTQQVQHAYSSSSVSYSRNCSDVRSFVYIFSAETTDLWVRYRETTRVVASR